METFPETAWIVLKALVISSILAVVVLYCVEFGVRLYRFFSEDGISSWHYGRKDIDD